MKAHRLVLLSLVGGGLAFGALAPATGCNGTGTTPMCDYADGANDPESGCGELVEAAAASEDSPSTETDALVDAPVKPDASPDGDATVPPDTGGPDTGPDAKETDAKELDAKDSAEDVKDSSEDHKG